MLDTLRGLRHHHLPTVAFVILILINLGLYIDTISKTLSFEYGADWGEGNMLAISDYINEGDWPLDITTEPYIALSYPPLMPAAVALLADDPSTMLTIGRVWAILSYIGCFFLIYGIARQLKVDWKVALLCASVAILITAARTWSSLYRVDMPACFFSFLGMYIFLKADTAGRWWWILAAIPISMALWTKQMYFSAGLAILIYLLLSTRYRDATRWVAACVGLACLVALPGIAIMGPEFIESFTTTTWAPMSMCRFQPLLRYVMMTSLGIIALGWLGTVASAKYHDKGNHARVLGVWFVVAFIVGAVLSSKIGSSTNYYIEGLMVCCVLVAVSWKYWDNRLVHALLVSLIAGQAIVSIIYPVSYETYEFPQMDMPAAQADIAERIKDDAWVLSEDITMMVMLDKEPKYEQLMHRVWAIYGKLDESPLVEDVKNQRFGHIITFYYDPFLYVPDPNAPPEFRKWTPEMQQAIVDNYEIEKIYCREPYHAYAYFLLRPAEREEHVP